MKNLVMDKELKNQYKAAVQRLDNNVREIEEIHEEMDEYLYSIEKRIARLRRNSKRD